MNKDNWQQCEPTDAQLRLAEQVEQAVLQELKLLGPVPAAVILTGLFSAIAKIISYQSGEDQVAPWFERQAAIAREIQGQLRRPN